MNYRIRNPLVLLLVLAACGDADPTPVEDTYAAKAAYAIVAATPQGDRAGINRAFQEQSDYQDAWMWRCVERLIELGRIRVTDKGMFVVPHKEWPKK